jgi:hypothetical protein
MWSGSETGMAQAKGHMHKHMLMSACIHEEQASEICLCGTGANGKPAVCQPGQWCHAFANTWSRPRTGVQFHSSVTPCVPLSVDI